MFKKYLKTRESVEADVDYISMQISDDYGIKSDFYGDCWPEEVKDLITKCKLCGINDKEIYEEYLEEIKEILTSYALSFPKLIDRNVDYKFDGDMEEAFPMFNYIGCVYPFDGDSYYIDSNVSERLVSIVCNDGEFYGDLDSAKSNFIIEVPEVIEATITEEIVEDVYE